jgi:hypothetical protein
MSMQGMKTMAAILAVSGLLQGTVLGSTGQQGRAGRGGPPPEAVEACKNKSDGDAVEFATPDGATIKATCRQINGRLIAVPEGGPSGPPPGERSE